MKTSTALKKLHKAISVAAEDMEYDLPVLKENSIEWDGPFEWSINMTGGQSVFCGELGQYFNPLGCEKEIVKVMKEIEKNNMIVECNNSWAVSIYE